MDLHTTLQWTLLCVRIAGLFPLIQILRHRYLHNDHEYSRSPILIKSLVTALFIVSINSIWLRVQSLLGRDTTHLIDLLLLVITASLATVYVYYAYSIFKKMFTKIT